MTADDELVRRLNAELDAWEQRPDAARWRPTPPPPEVDLEALAVWAQQSIEAAQLAFARLAQAVVPIVRQVELLQEAQRQAQTERRRAAVPFWTEQPNRTRRRR